jgi:alpha,alpha-trehalase
MRQRTSMLRDPLRAARRITRSPRVLVFALLAACHASAPPPSAPTASTAEWYRPAQSLGDLFAEVQNARVFPDSKTFVDAKPLMPPPRIVSEFEAQRHAPGFDLRAFVASHFAPPASPPVPVARASADSSATMEAHIRALWPALTRPADVPDPRSSLIPLPEPYVVPGGRFREVYYWDSYFTMLGLVESGRLDLVQDMLDNFAHLVTTVGHVPNGNRTYYLGRSQPPYLAAMVALFASTTDKAHALRYLDALEKEHAFWMDGAKKLAPGTAWRRVVRLPNGAILNRYWDDIPEPRPESFREDYAVGQTVPASRREALYRNFRAAAESGWDFSSRWMRDPKDLRTLEVTDIAPVDLNSLLYFAEREIAAQRRCRGAKGDAAVADRYDSLASARRNALTGAAYDSTDGWFYDVRWRTAERVRDRPTLAGLVPLYFGLASPEQGSAVSARLARDFLAPGGFVTTLIASGQQWDAPNGWPPLEWLAIEGARRYDRPDVADSARARWLALNRRVFRATGKMTEKYDVMDLSRPAGGGEYPTQDGFGWTNGVALALSFEQSAEQMKRVPAPMVLSSVAGRVSCGR